MADTYKKDFLITAREDGEPSYPLGPLEGRHPGPYDAARSQVVQPPRALSSHAPTPYALINVPGAHGQRPTSVVGKYLWAMPQLRPLIFTVGKIHAESALGSSFRSYQEEAVVAYQVGQVQPGNSACTMCRGASGGRFRHCVVVNGLFRGACASCHYSQHARDCSLYR